MNALFAYLHHLAAFALVAALAIEFISIRDELTAKNARRILVADAIYGLSATVIVIVGLLRVFYFEKGSAYYTHNLAFIAKMSLFATVGILSAFPTIEFMSWRKVLRQGQTPTISDSKRRALRSIIHWELAGIALVILCAALMVKGYGQMSWES